MRVALHITHESLKKIGGIGSVLAGICNAGVYKDFYDRTCFYGPLFDKQADSIGQFGQSGSLLYSSSDNFDSGSFTEIFGGIAVKYNVDIVYGLRRISNDFDMNRFTDVDIINVGINRMKHEHIEKFKYCLWEKFGIESDQYKDNWDYEQYLRIGVVYVEIIEKLFGLNAEYVHFAHEYMGVAACLSVLINGRADRTVFVAHEVTTARSLVEASGGHDISFYNIVEEAKANKSLEQVFGNQEHNPRNELVKRSTHFDHIFAVGDHIRDEYLFLCPETLQEKIEVAYNAVSARDITAGQKETSRGYILDYARSLLNFTADVVFTHVTRLVLSKGIWRDIELLGFLDDIFYRRGLKGVYILLSTLIPTGRNSQEIFGMEREYGWPVMHKDGWPDLIGMEVDAYEQLRIFNAKSKAIKAVFLNQFGFSKSRCGKRVPDDAGFDDLRIASDAELGLSIYEPFGIAQIETIPFGGLSILSSTCGCVGLLKETFREASIKPFYIVDYIGAGKKMSLAALKDLSIAQRTAMEREVLKKDAEEIFDMLPLTAEKRETYLANAQKYARALCWDVAAEKYTSI